MNIGVIGAGAAGLAAGYDLSNAGHRVTVFESAPFIGGQASTIEVGGGRLERGYHHLFTNDHAIIELIEEIGLSDELKWFPSRVGTYASGRVYRTTTPLDLLRFGALPLYDRIKLGLFALRLQRLGDWRSLESFTADEWLRERLGGKAYEVVWNPLLRGKFGDSYDQVGMPWFWSKIQTRFASRKTVGGEQLGYPMGSFDSVFDEVARRIGLAGGQILLETPVERVEVSGEGVTGLTARRPDGTKHEEKFDVVVSTVPSYHFPELVDLPAAYKSKLDAVHYLAAVVIILELDRPLTNIYWMNIADHNVPFLGIIEHTNLIPRELYGGRYVAYLTNYLDRHDEMFGLTPDELLGRYLPHLRKFNPEFERSWIKRVHYNSVSAAQPIIGANYSSRMPDHRTPFKRLYLANTTQIYPEDRGTNYSVRMGREVAGMVLDDEKGHWRGWPANGGK